MINRDAPHIRSLTGLRAVAAVLVVLLHARRVNMATTGDLVTFGPLNDITAAGFGVDIFFVLSGFIMAYVYHQRFACRVQARDYLSFLWYRIARLYPLHIATMVIMILIYFIGKNVYEYTPTTGDASYSIASIAASMTMVHEWLDSAGILARLPILSNVVQSYGPFGTPNGVAWSISAEFFVYILVPFSTLIFANRNKVTLACCYALCALLFFC